MIRVLKTEATRAEINDRNVMTWILKLVDVTSIVSVVRAGTEMGIWKEKLRQLDCDLFSMYKPIC